MRGKFVGSVTIGERGQIVIPAEARKEFGLEVGDKLLVFSRHHGIVLMKADHVMDYVERTLADLTEIRAAASETAAKRSSDDGQQRADAADKEDAPQRTPSRRGPREGEDA